MSKGVLFNLDQLMRLAIAGFGREDWKYNSKDLFAAVPSFVQGTYRLYMNGKMIMSICFKSENDATFETSKEWRFNHMAAVKELNKVLKNEKSEL